MDSIHLPNAIALPTAFGAPGIPLSPGQVVQGLVLELIESDVFRLQLPQAVVDVRSDVPLTPGSTITLAVKTGGANAKLIIYSEASATGQGAPSLAGRQPVGEAVIVARAPTTALASIPAKTATEAPIARGALPASSADRAAQQPGVVAPRTVTPEQAVGEAVRVAATRQSGLAPLFADVEQAVQVAHALPLPVRAAADDLLALRVPLDTQISGADVKQAFVRSGTLFEPRLAAARAASAGVSQAPSIVPARVLEQNVVAAPAEDLKAALLVFRQALKMWAPSESPVRMALDVAADKTQISPVPPRQAAGDAAIRRLANALVGAPDEPIPARAPLSPEQATVLAKTVASAFAARETASSQPLPNAGATSPPPYRGAPLAAQAPAVPSLAPDAAPHEIADRLIAQTDGALARQTLLQVASLPEQSEMPRADAAQRWTFEIPFATPQGTSIAQFEVSRDARAPKSDPSARTWHARFSLDAEPMGPVHASVALSGARASVTLWAERAATAAQLNENASLLAEALRTAELEPADVQFRVGAPPAVRQAAPGRFMDRAT